MAVQELSTHQLDFRTAMANLSAAVVVVTTDGPLGRAGITVSAVCSVTDSPPTLLVCVNRSSRSHEVLAGNGRVGVNVLGAEHQDLAMHFAGSTRVPTEDRFGVGAWDLAGEVPVLRDALTSRVGRVVARHEQGSHSVLFVAVDEVRTRGDEAALVYFGRQFHQLTAGPAA